MSKENEAYEPELIEQINNSSNDLLDILMQDPEEWDLTEDCYQHKITGFRFTKKLVGTEKIIVSNIPLYDHKKTDLFLWLEHQHRLRSIALITSTRKKLNA